MGHSSTGATMFVSASATLEAVTTFLSSLLGAIDGV